MFTILTAESRISTINRIFRHDPGLEEMAPQDWIPHDARWSKEYFEKVAGAAAQFAQRDLKEGRGDYRKKTNGCKFGVTFFSPGFFGLA